MTILLSWVEFQGLQGIAATAHGTASANTVSAATKRSAFNSDGTSVGFSFPFGLFGIFAAGTATVSGVGLFGIPHPAIAFASGTSTSHAVYSRPVFTTIWTDADIDNTIWTPAQIASNSWAEQVPYVGT